MTRPPAARIVALPGGSAGGRSAPAADAGPAPPIDPAANPQKAAEPDMAPGFGLAMPPGRAWTPPVSGALAAIFGVASLFKMAWILAPLAVLLAILAGVRGHHGWAAIGLGTAIVGLAISPWFWTALGLAWLYQMWG